MEIIGKILLGIVALLVNEEASIASLRYVWGLSPLLTFIAQTTITSLALFFFWANLYEKILTWAENRRTDEYAQSIQTKKGLKKILSKIQLNIACSKIARNIIKRRSYEHCGKRKSKKVERIRALGIFGLYFGGLLPGGFHPALYLQKTFFRYRLGLWFIWLGSVTRIAIVVFTGLKLIEYLAKLMT